MIFCYILHVQRCLYIYIYIYIYCKCAAALRVILRENYVVSVSSEIRILNWPIVYEQCTFITMPFTRYCTFKVYLFSALNYWVTLWPITVSASNQMAYIYIYIYIPTLRHEYYASHGQFLSGKDGHIYIYIYKLAKRNRWLTESFSPLLSSRMQYKVKFSAETNGCV